MELKSLDSAIRTRRSIYTNMFSAEKVPDEIVREMLENARWAPTHKLTEPWQFVVFSGDGRKKLGEFQAEAYRARSTHGQPFEEKTFQKLLEKPMECSHVIAIGVHRDPRKSIPEIEEVCAVAAAVQNMWLTASAHRIGCYWSSGGITYYEGINEFFGWKPEDLLLGFLYLGMPATEKWPEGKRSGMEDKVRWITQE